MKKTFVIDSVKWKRLLHERSPDTKPQYLVPKPHQAAFHIHKGDITYRRARVIFNTGISLIGWFKFSKEPDLVIPPEFQYVLASPGCEWFICEHLGSDSGTHAQVTIEAATTTSDLVACDVDEPPGRQQVLISRIIRDSEIARAVKQDYGHRCQLCPSVIELPDGTKYAESHHVKPLGKGGLDRRDNIVCLCPNCHAKCDLGAIRLTLEMFKLVPGHSIDVGNIDFHNDHIYCG